MNAPTINIDGRTIEVEPGWTVLNAARALGIDIPTLCHVEKCGPLNSCQVCLVKVSVGGGPSRFVPSCGTAATPGLVVESETQEVHEARRTALELLFSDHVGDCLSPCHRLCPLLLNVPVMIRHIDAGRDAEAAALVCDTLPLPAALGRLCHHPCEQGCRRGNWDSPAAIRNMEHYVAKWNAAAPVPRTARKNAPTGRRVAVVGAGPAGLGSAYYLARAGHQVTIYDRHLEPGGSLRLLPPADLPYAEWASDLAGLGRLGVVLRGGVEIGTALTLDDLRKDHDAVVLATGETDKTGGPALGVATTATGVKTDPSTCLTNVPGVFATGAAVKPVKQLVKALAEARAAAECVNLFLAGKTPKRPEKPFSSVMGRMDATELKAFLRSASPADAESPCDRCRGLSQPEAKTESERCLHCDCRSSGACALQFYAQVYGADASRFRSERRPFEQQFQPGGIVFEPGKCILCGICVKLTEMAGEDLGLAFVGRGFNVQVVAPFSESVQAGLRKVGAECVENCPTGALSFDDSVHAPRPVCLT
jgi:ferredoxin